VPVDDPGSRRKTLDPVSVQKVFQKVHKSHSTLITPFAKIRCDFKEDSSAFIESILNSLHIAFGIPFSYNSRVI
jgi:hypothetical protein